ncbi:hypothetical protein L6452_03315 [Arctium lappa]|uniref:Uncharacterized protein n=1 Tax=Arctium lappa TaxID=4217 RepID=A0ACB9FLW5_ARCLA|nr:hypothetical protein L6452_03315 [Arctium lappa]
MPIQELYEILMTDESMVMEQKAKIDKKYKPLSVDPIALLARQLAEQALTETAYDGSTDDDDGEALEKAMILLTQHYQKRFKHKSGSNNLRFTSAKMVEQKKDEKKVVNCFNCGKLGHMVKDVAFYRKKLALAEKKESGTILLAEEEYWLDHSDNEAENEENTAMCFIGDDNSDDEEEDTSSDGYEFKFFWTTEKQILEEENVKRMKNKRMEMPFVYTSENAKYFPYQSKKSRKFQILLNVKSSNKSSFSTDFVDLFNNTEKENVSPVSYDTKKYIPPLVLEEKIVDLEDRLEEQNLQTFLENDLFLFIMKTSFEDKISSGFSKDSKENVKVWKNNGHLRSTLETQTESLRMQLDAQISVCASNGKRKPPPDLLNFENFHSKASSSMSNAKTDFFDKVSSSYSIIDDSLLLNAQFYKKKCKRRRSKKSKKHDTVLSENSNISDFSFSDRTVRKSPRQIWRMKQQFSAACTPQQNGVVERRNRTLVEYARSMLAYLGLPLSYWAEAVTTACHTQNRSILHRRFNKTPYELMNRIKPNIKYFKSFGCKCYVLNDRENLNKFSPKADEGVFVCYSSNSTAYRVFLISARKFRTCSFTG